MQTASTTVRCLAVRRRLVFWPNAPEPHSRVLFPTPTARTSDLRASTPPSRAHVAPVTVARIVVDLERRHESTRRQSLAGMMRCSQ